MSTAPAPAPRNSPNERWKSNRPPVKNDGWKVSSRPSGGTSPETWKMTSSVSDVTNRQTVRMPSLSPSLSSHVSQSGEHEGWKMSGRNSNGSSSTSPTQSLNTQPSLYFPPTPVMSMPEAIPTPRISHDNSLTFEDMQARRQSAPAMHHGGSDPNNAYGDDGNWQDYTHHPMSHNYQHHDPYAYTPQMSSMPSPATFTSNNMGHMMTPSATPKPLPEEPPMPPPRKSLPGGFVMPEPGFSTPSPMLQPHDHIPFEYHNRQQPPYRHSIATSEFPSYHSEPTPPLSQASSTSPAAPTPAANVEPVASAGKKDKNKKDKDKGKGKPERKVRQITVPSINKEHRVWINVDPTETGLSLAEKIHIIATFRTRKILSITTASGRQIPLDHRPIFGSWVDMEKFVDGEPWKVEWGDLDKGVVDKLLSKMVSGNRKPAKRDDRVDRV